MLFVLATLHERADRGGLETPSECSFQSLGKSRDSQWRCIITRADFYVGRGPDAEWIGSIAFDGHPSGMSKELLAATTEADYRKEVASRMQETGSATLPSQGWPWPWDDSRTTDYAYAFDGGKVWAACFGYEWFDPLGEEPDIDGMTGNTCVFPDMRDGKNVTLGERSGLIVFRATGQ